MKVSEVMTDNVFTLSSDDTMAKALSIMYEKSNEVTKKIKQTHKVT